MSLNNLQPPAISVVMSVYNGASYLKESVESTLGQTFRDFEFIIINDGSSDDTAAILEAYAQDDSRIRLVSHEHRGLVVSLNLGCQLARGQYIVRMDADDVAYVNRLERQNFFMEQHPEIAVAGTALRFVNEKNQILGTWFPPIDSQKTSDELLKYNCIWHPTVIMRRSAFIAQGGYRTQFERAEDYDLWLRMSESFSVSNMPETLLDYRVHAGQTAWMHLEQQVLSLKGARLAAQIRRGKGVEPFVGGTKISLDQLIDLGMNKECFFEDFVNTYVNYVGLKTGQGFGGSLCDYSREISRSLPNLKVRCLKPIAVRRLIARKILSRGCSALDRSRREALAWLIIGLRVFPWAIVSQEFFLFLFKLMGVDSTIQRHAHVKHLLKPLKQYRVLRKIAQVLRALGVNYQIKYVAFKRYLRTRKDILFLKYAYKGNKKKVAIIVADFSGYPLYRDKDIHGSVIKCGIGRLFENMTRFRAGLACDVILVINSATSKDREEKQEAYNSLLERYSFISKIIFRDNAGFDFGAYNCGYQYLKNIGHEGDILLMNSSVRGPFNDFWLLKYSYLLHQNKLGLCGISLNSHDTHNESIPTAPFRPHVQSFFMLTTMNVLKEVFNDALPGSEITSGNHSDIIVQGEMEFSRAVLDHGFGIGSNLFDKFVYYKNATWVPPYGDTRYSHLFNQFSNKI